MDLIESELVEVLAKRGIRLTEQQNNQFDRYYQLLVEWNKRMNLTAITERRQVYLKHYYDSVSLSFFASMNEVDNVIDVGSGAGFPGIPLKIVFPHLRLTIVDSLAKRIQFLKEVANTLGLSHVNFIHARAEDAAREPSLRDRFDMATARAVARLSVLNELCLPFVKVGGIFVAMKGADIAQEVQEAAFSLAELKAMQEAVHPFELPDDGGRRHIVICRKSAPTPAKYPRKAGVPGKQPLI